MAVRRFKHALIKRVRRGEDKDGAKKTFIITNPVYCLWISGFNFDWDRAAYASVCQSVRGKHEFY